MLQVPLTLHIGATIDFEAGVVKRAPKWISYAGMEWLYRLLKEPRRLYRRYLLDDLEIFPIFWKYRKQPHFFAPESCNILGVDIAVTNMQSVCYYLTKNLERLRGEYVCVSNVHTTVMAYNDASYKEVQNNAAIAVPDGKPLSLISRVRGYKSAQRVAGPEYGEDIKEPGKKSPQKISEIKDCRNVFAAVPPVDERGRYADGRAYQCIKTGFCVGWAGCAETGAVDV